MGKRRFPCETFPAISELLDFQRVDTGGGPGSPAFRFLRPPQFEALVAYWYLRLIAKTPRVIALYRQFFPKPTDLLQALGIDTPEMKDVLLDSGGDVDALLDRIRSDDEFVEQHCLESLRETLRGLTISW